MSSRAGNFAGAVNATAGVPVKETIAMKPLSKISGQKGVAGAEGGTVLVVDDERDTLFITVKVLESAGIRCLAASSGRECIAVAQREPVDLILLDLLMPEMDGWETLAALRAAAATKDIPVIMLTCVEGLRVRTQAMQAGVSQFLSRPVPRNTLVDCVRTHLRAAAQTKALVARHHHGRRGSGRVST